MAANEFGDNVRQIINSYPQKDPSLFLRIVMEGKEKNLKWCVIYASKGKETDHSHYDKTNEGLVKAETHYQKLKEKLESLPSVSEGLIGKLIKDEPIVEVIEEE